MGCASGSAGARWREALACQYPSRFGLCLLILPLEAGSGQALQSLAKAASEWKPLVPGAWRAFSPLCGPVLQALGHTLENFLGWHAGVFSLRWIGPADSRPYGPG